MDDLMLFFLLALWRESWLAVVTPSAERLEGQRKERVKLMQTVHVRATVVQSFWRVPAKFTVVVEACPWVSVCQSVQS